MPFWPGPRLSVVSLPIKLIIIMVMIKIICKRKHNLNKQTKGRNNRETIFKTVGIKSVVYHRFDFHCVENIFSIVFTLCLIVMERQCGLRRYFKHNLQKFTSILGCFFLFSFFRAGYFAVSLIYLVYLIYLIYLVFLFYIFSLLVVIIKWLFLFL